MEITLKKLNDIHPYEKNPRKNDAAVGPVAESIKQFGFKVPIVIDKDGVIVCGHTRYKAAKRLKLKEVPCVIADDLSDEQIRAFRLADNKVGEFAEWDLDILGEEIDSILNIDMTDFGFEITLDDPDPEEIEEDEFDETLPEEPVSKLGQIWKLGNHRLMCGDSTNTQNVLELLGGVQVDLCITDPPYNVDYEGKTKDALKIENDSMTPERFFDFLTHAFESMSEALKPGGAFYVWYASREPVNFERALNEAGFEVRQQLIWNKNSMVLGWQDYQWKHEPCLYGWKDGAGHYFTDDRTLTTVFDVKRPKKSTLHPTMKPVELISMQMKNSSKPGEKVLDLFGGSGTTLIAAEQMNRCCYMMEYDPHYADVIIHRWEQLTGKKAELIKE